MAERTLLAVVAHPDDESYALGGTLARYAAEGVDVHVAVATDGAAGSVDEKWQGDRSRLAEARAEELKAASKILGVTLHDLGYRDSGYIGDEANKHPAAFINVNKEEATGRVVELIRQVQPQVVITHDETGGYYHPDHIQCHDITTAAFQAAGDPDQHSEHGLAPFQPSRLYYYAFSNRWVRFLVLVSRLRGQDPTKGGRNKDVDFTNLGVPPEKITATLDYREFWDVKKLASAQHASQGGGTGFSRLFPEWLQKQFLAKETFIRAQPPAPNGYKETDLFESI